MSSTSALFIKSEVKNSFSSGFTNTFRSLGLSFGNRKLLIYFVIPFLLNIIMLSMIFYFSYTSAIPMVQSFLSGDQWYMHFIRLLVSPVLFVLLSILTVLIYSIMGGIVTAPFLDLLSAETEKVLGAENDEKFSLKEMLSDILRALMNTIRLLVLVIIINIVLLLLNIIPGGSFIYAFLNFMTALFFYGFQFYDFPLERRRYRFDEKLKITWKFKWAVAGTGLAFFLVSFIPVVGFLGFNLCTVGAALTFTEDIKPSLTSQA
jgi:CysZ protein